MRTRHVWSSGFALRTFVVLLALLSAVAAPGAERTRSPLTELLLNQGYQELPLEIIKPNRLSVRAKVRSRSVPCELDTGADRTLLDADHARGLKRLESLKGPVNGMFGAITTRVERVTMDRLELGGLLFTNEPAEVMKLPTESLTPTGSLIPVPAGPTFAGLLLGRDFLMRHHALVNCRAPCVYVRDTPPSKASLDHLEATLRGSGMIVMPLEGFWNVSGQVNDRPALFYLDTGSSFSEIDWNQLADLGLGQHQSLGQEIDLTGSKQQLQFTDVPSLKLGSLELKHQRVGVISLKHINDSLQRFGLPRLQGILSLDVLYPACALIDCAGHRLFLSPVARPQLSK